MASGALRKTAYSPRRVWAAVAVRWVLVRSGVGAAFAPALHKAEAVAVHLQDVNVVGDRGGGAFIALAEGLEEQFCAGLGQRHEEVPHFAREAFRADRWKHSVCLSGLGCYEGSVSFPVERTHQ